MHPALHQITAQQYCPTTYIKLRANCRSSNYRSHKVMRPPPIQFNVVSLDNPHRDLGLSRQISKSNWVGSHVCRHLHLRIATQLCCSRGPGCRSVTLFRNGADAADEILSVVAGPEILHEYRHLAQAQPCNAPTAKPSDLGLRRAQVSWIE